MKQWDANLHARIAEAIKQARGKRSAQWLADRTSELGYPITRTQIANYESGRKRTLDIADLLVLAAALNMSPACLVFPGPYDAEVEFLPGRHELEVVAVNWFSGIEPPDSLGGVVVEREPNHPFRGSWEEWHDNTALLQLTRALRELEDMRNDFLSDHDTRQLGEEWAFKRLNSIEEQIRVIKRQLTEMGRDA